MCTQEYADIPYSYSPKLETAQRPLSRRMDKAMLVELYVEYYATIKMDPCNTINASHVG